jgi:ATP-dependent RNA helicase DDX18/HAS1
LEKLLQKNYYLYQSARDGFRAYLQSYASYSLKKIYNVNALDLAKVGKAFGFAVPPKVNINMGEGSTRTPSGKKRRRDADADEDEEDWEDIPDEPTAAPSRGHRRDDNRHRRKETLGQKRVKKEVYRATHRQADESTQWTR